MVTYVDWLTFRPATPIAKSRAYIDLPAFTYENSWLGASEIITQFNYSASKNFVLRNRPAAPSGVNFCLCIRWRSGGNVYRWKLWQGVGEVLNVPLYNGEVIKKHFVLEVWTTNNATINLDSSLRILTSVVSVPANFYSVTNTALATGVEYNRASQLISTTAKTLPFTSDLIFRFESDSGLTVAAGEVTSWTDQVSGGSLAPRSGFSNPLYASTDPDVNNKPIVRIISASPLYRTGVGFSGTQIHLFMILRQRAWASNRAICRLARNDALYGTDGPGENNDDILGIFQKSGGSTPQVQGFTEANSIGTLAQIPVPGVSGTFRILEAALTDSSAVLNTRSLADGSALETVNITGGLYPIGFDDLWIGWNFAGGGDALIDVAAFIAFDEIKTGSDVNAILDYFSEKYGGAESEFAFPVSFNTGNDHLSND